MNDRLSELTGGRGGGNAVAPFEIAIDVNDTGDAGRTSNANSKGFMEGFFDKVNAVKKDIDAVKKVRFARRAVGDIVNLRYLKSQKRPPSTPTTRRMPSAHDYCVACLL